MLLAHPLESQLESLNLWHSGLQASLRRFAGRFGSAGGALTAAADRRLFRAAVEGLHYEGPVALQVRAGARARAHSGERGGRFHTHSAPFSLLPCGASAPNARHAFARACRRRRPFGRSQALVKGRPLATQPPPATHIPSSTPLPAPSAAAGRAHGWPRPGLPFPPAAAGPAHARPRGAAALRDAARAACGVWRQSGGLGGRRPGGWLPRTRAFSWLTLASMSRLDRLPHRPRPPAHGPGPKRRPPGQPAAVGDPHPRGPAPRPCRRPPALEQLGLGVRRRLGLGLGRRLRRRQPDGAARPRRGAPGGGQRWVARRPRGRRRRRLGPAAAAARRRSGGGAAAAARREREWRRLRRGGARRARAAAGLDVWAPGGAAAEPGAAAGRGPRGGAAARQCAGARACGCQGARGAWRSWCMGGGRLAVAREAAAREAACRACPVPDPGSRHRLPPAQPPPLRRARRAAHPAAAAAAARPAPHRATTPTRPPTRSAASETSSART
jgi:hypothetical protein